MVSEEQIEAFMTAYFSADTSDMEEAVIAGLTAAKLCSYTKEAYTVVRKKFYHSEWEMPKLLEARNGGLVTDEGEAWFYEHTSKDGTGGRYDMLFRRVYTHPIPSEPAPARNRRVS